MVAPVTKAQLRAAQGDELYLTVRKACRIARDGVPGPVFVEVPADLFLFKHDVDLDREGRVFESAATSDRPVPSDAELDRAAEMLESADRPLLYLGLGAAGARRDILALAEHLEAPVATTFQGKGVFPESHPLFLWPGFGDAAPKFVRGVAGACDLVLAIGVRFGEVATASYGMEMPGPLIHVDIDAHVPGRNYDAALPVHADAAAFLAGVRERLGVPAGEDRALRDRIADGHRTVEDRWSRTASDDRVTPAVLLRSLQARLGPKTVYATDSGNGTFLAMEMLRLDAPGRFLAPVDYSCMGYSVPAAVGAKLARPDAPVVALAGDGAFLMTGLELLTAAHHDVGVAVFVLRDRELAQIAQFQETALNRKTASEVADYDLAALCRGLGVECLALETDEAVPEVLDRVEEATASGRPIAVDVAIDYGLPTFFTKGVVMTNLRRLPWPDRIRFVGRAVGRRILGG